MIPIFDLTREYKEIASDLASAFTATAKNGVYILGRNVTLFEKEFARYVRVPYAVGVASGTDALTLGLKALGIGGGDEVILPANSYPTAFGVAQSGVRIRLTDVNDDGTMDPVRLSAAITRRTRAVVPVHLYGNPADVISIKKILGKNKIVIVEDAAQAHGTKIRVSKVSNVSKVKTSDTSDTSDTFFPAGSLGDIGCFSFYPTKNLGALGDAGMIVTHDKKIALHIKQLRMYGETKRYDSNEVSGVSRLDELQAAFLRVKLRHLNSWVKRRRDIARMYTEGLRNTGDLRFISSPGSSYHLFVIRTTHRDKLQRYLAKKEIGSAVHYPTPIHLVRACKNLGYTTGDFPVSEALSREVLSLPMFPYLTKNEVLQVIRAVKGYFR